MLKDELKAKRPSRDESFVENVQSRLRTFVEKDWKPIKAMLSAIEPELEEIDEWLQNRKQFDETHYIRKHYVAEDADTGKLLGYGPLSRTLNQKNSDCKSNWTLDKLP